MPVVTLSKTNSDTLDIMIAKNAPNEALHKLPTIDIGISFTSMDNLKRGLWKFDLGSIPKMSTINSAKLNLQLISQAGWRQKINIHKVTSAWNGLTTWNTAPTFDPFVYSSLVPLASSGIMTFDVKTLVQEWVNGASVNYGFLLKQVNENQTNDYVTFGSFDNSTVSYQPTLVIDYTSNNPPTLRLTSPFENLLGTDGNCEDPTKFATGYGASPTTFTTSTDHVYGSHSIEYKANGSSARMRPISLTPGKYYLLACVSKSSDGVTQITSAIRKADAVYIKTAKAAPTDFAFDYKAFIADGTEQYVGFFYTPSGGNGTGYIDGIRLYEITQEIYNKINMDPNCTGDKLTQKFPYTDTTISQTLSEGNGFSVEGTSTEIDPGNVLTVKYKINNGTPQALQSGVSDGSTPLSFAKTLTFRNKRLRDGTTDVTGADLAENVDHTLTVWAEDDQGGKSTEVVRKFRVIHNRAPIISDQDRNLGTIKSSPSITYTAADPEENPFTITEKINGSTIRSYSGVPNRQETLTIPANKWLMLEPGVPHTLTITAADEQGKSSSRTFTFTRQVNEILFEGLQVPMETDIAAERILLTPDWQIPLGAEVRVEVCNNGFDAEPTWEDCTIPAKMGRGYAFLNTVKTAEKWGVNFRVRIQKGTATSEASLSGIGGAYDVHPSL